MKHPAKYNDKFIPVFAKILRDRKRVLDPMAGTGKLASVKSLGFGGQVFCNDIDDWGDAKNSSVDVWTQADAAHLPYAAGAFDAICTSPTYGNGMGQKRFHSEKYPRILTYTAHLGKIPEEGSTAAMQWGPSYREKHREIYSDCIRVLAAGGVMIVNVSDFIKRGQVVQVSNWHRDTLLACGLKLVADKRVQTRRMRFGANRDKRVKHERILVFQKPS